MTRDLSMISVLHTDKAYFHNLSWVREQDFEGSCYRHWAVRPAQREQEKERIEENAKMDGTECGRETGERRQPD